MAEHIVKYSYDEKFYQPHQANCSCAWHGSANDKDFLVQLVDYHLSSRGRSENQFSFEKVGFVAEEAPVPEPPAEPAPEPPAPVVEEPKVVEEVKAD